MRKKCDQDKDKKGTKNGKQKNMDAVFYREISEEDQNYKIAIKLCRNSLKISEDLGENVSKNVPYER